MNQPNRVNLTDRDKNYRAAFGTDAGQRVLADLKSGLLFGQTLYSNNQSNEELHYLIGRQSVIHDILFILNKEQLRE